ncbi:nucleotidyltransferase [Dyadobacter beijingensis]|uniref:Nucleotidyltransferase n=1 Tax=Dyadobacter beijingensis TaxID=365489 RepID=A0ABQ2I1A4_9BACT|nr:nucleotidyltransferase domain-containing protein [Dyadobacter beijingensis]GGM97582.1 nucleotidyltransferase [Dyadobacter beijingensis]
MDTFTDVMQILEKLKPELAEKYHVSSIGLFGSIVRDDFTSESDVEILVDFNQPIGIEFVALADFIENKIGKTIDLVSKKGCQTKVF